MYASRPQRGLSGAQQAVLFSRNFSETHRTLSLVRDALVVTAGCIGAAVGAGVVFAGVACTGNPPHARSAALHSSIINADRGVCKTYRPVM